MTRPLFPKIDRFLTRGRRGTQAKRKLSLHDFRLDPLGDRSMVAISRNTNTITGVARSLVRKNP